jgi:hypothetical protein
MQDKVAHSDICTQAYTHIVVMYAYMHVCVNVYLYIHTYIRTDTHIVHACRHTHKHTHARTPAHTHTHKHTNTYTQHTHAQVGGHGNRTVDSRSQQEQRRSNRPLVEVAAGSHADNQDCHQVYQAYKHRWPSRLELHLITRFVFVRFHFTQVSVSRQINARAIFLQQPPWKSCST